ncbi:type II CAAX prenyl endopeptidase Rce1 family protein [Ureibacillus sp. NPDC094379]
MLRFIGRLFFMIASTFLIVLVIILLDSKLELGFSDLEMNTFILPFILIFNFFIVYPNLRKSFYKQFIKVKELHLLIALPILISIIELLLVYIYILLPIFFNKEPVSIGSNQYVESETLTSLGDFLLTGILGPFTEEVIFRFLLLYLLPYTLLRFLYNERAFIKRIVSESVFLFGKKIYKNMTKTHSKVFIIIWIILVSCLFSLVHGPDLWSFPIYFIGGVIPGYLYIKYGFLSAWIVHGSFNALSPIMNTVVIMFLNLLLK